MIIIKEKFLYNKKITEFFFFAKQARNMMTSSSLSIILVKKKNSQDFLGNVGQKKYCRTLSVCWPFTLRSLSTGRARRAEQSKGLRGAEPLMRTFSRLFSG